LINALKNKNPANEVRRVSYLGLQLISRSDHKLIRQPKLIAATSCWYGCFWSLRSQIYKEIRISKFFV